MPGQSGELQLRENGVETRGGARRSVHRAELPGDSREIRQILRD